MDVAFAVFGFASAHKWCIMRLLLILLYIHSYIWQFFFFVWLSVVKLHDNDSPLFHTIPVLRHYLMECWIARYIANIVSQFMIK